MTADIILNPFGGPGGWDEAARALSLRLVGIETDRAACFTRAAAGHPTIRFDAAQFPAELYAGLTWGFVGSPVCIAFSACGSRGGVAILAELAAAIRHTFAGCPPKGRAEHRRRMAAALRAAGWPQTATADMTPGEWQQRRQGALRRRLSARQGNRAAMHRAITATRPGGHLTRAEQSERIWRTVRLADLVVEPARYIMAADPEWVVLEQVPEVMPLWQVYADELRSRGYSVWCGVLNAADYGAGQARRRAILIASRTLAVAAPEPTHYDPRRGGPMLWGAVTPWVSMADVLGWGCTERPAPTVTAGGTAQGGWEPFGRRSREMLAAEQAAGRWKPHPDDPAITSRLKIHEAAALQSFRPGYPFKGTACERYEQAGNAVPPALGLPVLAEATGRRVAALQLAS